MAGNWRSKSIPRFQYIFEKCNPWHQFVFCLDQFSIFEKQNPDTTLDQFSIFEKPNVDTDLYSVSTSSLFSRSPTLTQICIRSRPVLYFWEAQRWHRCVFALDQFSIFEKPNLEPNLYSDTISSPIWENRLTFRCLPVLWVSFCNA